MKPLCVDLYAGLGGWSEGFLSEGYECIGFDVERHDYGTGGYPGRLVLQDVLTLDGAQFRGAACIVASPPCQRYSYMAMPWGGAKREIAWQEWERHSPFGCFRLNDLFDACFRIQREASAAAGRWIPMVVENVQGAQRWVGTARWHFGSYYLWGDVPALMPFSGGLKNTGGSWFAQAHNTTSGHCSNPVSIPAAQRAGVKVGGNKLSEVGFNVAAAQRYRHGVKQNGSGREWFDQGIARHSSCSDSRKAASAQIAKIPFDLAAYIARCFKPA